MSKYCFNHLLECYIIASSSVILECPTGEACINDVLQYNCTINGDIQNWIVTDIQQSSKTVRLDQFGQLFPSQPAPYTVTFIDYIDANNQLSSSLTLVATLQSNKTEIACKNNIDSMKKECTVQIIGL